MTKSKYRIFLVIPLVTLLIIPIFVDSNGISKLFALVLGITVLTTAKETLIFTLNKKSISLIPLILLIPYLISQLIKPNDIDKFLIGSPGRNGGFISWLILAILIIYISNFSKEYLLSFERALSITYLVFLSVGILQYLNLLPWKQSIKFSGLSITLGNPNFASALLAIMCSVHLNLIVYEKKYRNLSSFLILSLGLFELWQTESLQGILIFFSNGMIIFATYFKSKLKRIIIKKRNLVIAPLSLIALFVTFYLFLFDWFVANGSVRQRLSYWNLSLEIFRDNFWFGVGIDNLRGSVLEYRDLNLVRQEGVFTIPDRTHNVLLDHLVNGGIFAGLLWLIFIITISIYAIKLLSENIDNVTEGRKLVIVLCWFGYLIQSFISVDHLALTLLGYVSAGFVLALSNRKLIDSIKKSTRSTEVLKKVIQSFFSICLVYISLFFRSEFYSYKIINTNDVISVEKVLESRWVQPQTLEVVAVYISKAKQFELANRFADKMLTKSPKSHQAFYMKSVYQESLGDNLKGRDWMLKAHEVDPLNPVYLLSLAIYEYKLGNLDMARTYVRRTEEIDPNQKALTDVKKLLQ